MFQLKTQIRTEQAVLHTRSLRYVADRRAKTKAAAKNARRIAGWITSGASSRNDSKTEQPDEHALFTALQACSCRATRKLSDTAAAPADRIEWSSRRRLIRDYIIDRNLGLAFSMVARFTTSTVDRDDLRSEALLALVRATEGFDPWRGFRFSTYACQAIGRALAEATRKSNRYRFHVHLESEPDNEGCSDTSDASELYVDRLRCALRDNRGDLTERESTILAGRFPVGGGSSRTLSQIGDALGLTKERVRQLQESALAKLRSALEADPFLQ